MDTKENMKFLKALARKRSRYCKDLTNDLIQEGYLALNKAIDTFNPKLGVPFWGYATCVVNRAMSKTLRNMTQIIATSLNEETQACQVFSTDSDDDCQRKEICDCEHPTPQERYEMSDSIAIVRYLVEQLPNKERVAVTLSYGLDGLYERNLADIADELDCSVEGARKILGRGTERLRGWLSSPQYSLCA